MSFGYDAESRQRGLEAEAEAALQFAGVVRLRRRDGTEAGRDRSGIGTYAALVRLAGCARTGKLNAIESIEELHAELEGQFLVQWNRLDGIGVRGIAWSDHGQSILYSSQREPSAAYGLWKISAQGGVSEKVGSSEEIVGK